MLKTLAILAMFFSVTHTLMPATGKASNDDGSERQGSRNETASSQAQANPVPSIIPKPPEPSHPNPKATNKSAAYTQDSVTIIESAAMPGKRDWLDYTSLIVGVMLAFITGAGVIAAWRGLPVILRQAKGAEDAARAAKDGAAAAFSNAQAVINAERPWLMENITRSKDSDRKWIVSIRNAGNTPSEVVDGYWCLSLLGGTFELPADHKRNHFLLQNTITVKPDSFEVTSIDMRLYHEEAVSALLEESKLFYLHGDVVYWDTFTDRSLPNAKPHVTQWCYVYSPPTREFTRAPCTYHGHS
jgi:hypothetical protein